MSLIPQHFIDDLLTRLDIVDIIDRRVKLKKTGKNYSACCPFHDEKTPSFTVSPDKQFYYCFGCGANGNAVGFIMEYERQSFVESIETLAQYAGVEVPKETNKTNQKHDLKRKKLYELLTKASAYYQLQLKQHSQRNFAVNYLKNRGLTGNIAKQFGLGFAPPGWDNLLNHLSENNTEPKLLVDSGLIIEKVEENKRYDRFRQRITFPIHDVRGRVIGFGGRVLGDDKPKYLNSPETDVFHKGKELYGLYEAKKSNKTLDSLIVVEGYMDVIALAQFGIKNAVATLGTACGEDHLTLAFKHSDEVIFCFDGDKAGRSAAKRALLNSLTSMQDGRQIKFLFLPEGQDPDTLVRQIGTDRFIGVIKNALPIEDFLFEVAAEGIDINSMEGRAKFSKIAAPLVGKIPEGVYRELMFDNLAKRTGLSPELLRELQKEKIELGLAEQNEQPRRATAKEQHNHQESAPHSTSTAHDTSQNMSNLYEEVLASNPNRGPKPLNHNSKSQSIVALTPVKIATILLLENPKLLTTTILEEELQSHHDPEIERLNTIISYIQKRPDCNFNNIMGFWAGAHGLGAQQELAELVANQCFGSAKTIESYDMQLEFKTAINILMQRQKLTETTAELERLKATPREKLTAEDKKRYVELVFQANKQTKPAK